MHISKNTIVRRIRRAAQNYKQYLLGKTFMFVYDNRYVEIMFKKVSFMHLTGVGSNLDAKNFFNHAIKGNTLKPSEISFNSSSHPFDLANKKTKVLSDLYKITVNDTFIVEDVFTLTATYKIGITDVEMVILFGEDIDSTGKKVSECLVPYSFRKESINNNKFSNMYSVDFVFSKQTGMKKYNEITFQDKKIEDLPELIKNKIDIQDRI